MKKHTMQEWADFLGVALVKNNFRTDNNPPGVFHRLQVSAFLEKPSVTPQHYGKPCYACVPRGCMRDSIANGVIYQSIDDLNFDQLYQFVSDIEECEDFTVYEPDTYGDYLPCVPLSSSSIKQMEIADALKPGHGTVRHTRGDPIDMLETKNPETNIEQIEKKYKEKSK